MATERYVLLGVATPRARWFREVGQWAQSAAIVVLIMALIGAAMWVAFNGMFQDASSRASSSVQRIGG